MRCCAATGLRAAVRALATPACARSKAWRRATGWLRGDGADRGRRSASTAGSSRVDVAHGHKTGFYLDQRDNRQRFADAVRHFGCGAVLNCFCYTGGFSRRRAGRRRARR